MRKNEMKFLTDLKKSFKREGAWFYKIPDSFGNARFTPAKPFDAIMCVNGGFISVEGKWLDISENKRGFSYKDLRDSQQLGLQHVEDHGGQSWVALGLRVKRGENRALFWEHKDFKKLCQSFDGTIPWQELIKMPFVKYRTDKPVDISQVLEEMKANIFFQNLIA